MKCPNCGKTVRSKTQCAHCGHVFDKDDKKELKVKEVVYDDNTSSDDTYVDYSRSSRSKTASVLWSLVKLVIAVAIVFVAFLFGPTVIDSVMNYFNPETEVAQEVQSPEEGQPTDGNEGGDIETPTLVSNEGEEDSETEEGADDGQTTAEESGQDSASEGEESEEEEAAGLALASSDVNLDNYPLISVSMDFEEDLDQVASDTFVFSIETNGNTVDLGNDYSLVKEGQNLTLSFNDPAIAVLSTEPTQQTLRIASESLEIEESVEYELPSVSVSGEMTEAFNAIINDNLSDLGQVSVVSYEEGESIPLVYDDQTKEAGTLISWFVIAHTYHSIDQGDLSLEDLITINPDLIAAGDQGYVATTEEVSEFSVRDLIVQVINNLDPTALNHLIQANGGPNEFNLWMNESNFFATRVTQLLSLNEAGYVEGAVTNATDIASLLQALANNELVSEELDQNFKDLLLDSPLTYKFPVDQPGNVQTRFEIATSDGNLGQQYYSGILQLENGYHIVVILLSDFEDVDSSVLAISNTISELLTTFETGERANPEEEEEETEEVVEEENSQIEFVDESIVPETNPSDEGVFTSETGITYGPDLDGDGMYDTYQAADGTFVPISWSQGADGLWYFTPAYE